MSDNKAKLSTVFAKGNFSCDLRVEIGKKEDFVKRYAGKLNTDINKLYAEIGKAKIAYDKAAEKEAKAAEKSADKAK